MTEPQKKTANETDVPTPENGSATEPAAAPAESAGTPSADVAALQAEIASLKEQLLYARAEAQNIARRAAKEREDTAKYAAGGFAKELLPVADNLRRALEAIPQDALQTDRNLKLLAEGVEMTEKALLTAFEKFSIRKIVPLDEPFDHNFHQAMFEVENTGKPAGTVVQVLQSGYVVHDRLLRPAMVGVAKGDANQVHVDTSV